MKCNMTVLQSMQLQETELKKGRHKLGKESNNNDTMSQCQ